MGKGKRNREHKANRPRRAIPEMLPDTPDSMDDLPKQGKLSPASRDHLDPGVNAWGLLNSYIALLMTLETNVTGQAAGITDDEQRRRAVEMLNQLRPLELAGDKDDAAEFISRMKPRWRREVINRILREPKSWTDESGYEPDPRDWFTGARRFLKFMVPDQHREQAMALLDYDALLAETARVNTEFPAGDQVPGFDLANPEHSVWFAHAMAAHPVAAIHAAGALAVWIQAQPGAVNDIQHVRTELAERSLEFARIVATAPGRNPNEPEEPERPWTPPWEVAAEEVPTWRTEPMGDEVPIRYDGPPMTPWQAAYLYAEVITAMADENTRLDPIGTDLAKVQIARAISIRASTQGLLPSGPGATVDSPGALDAVSIPHVAVQHLHEITSTVEFVDLSLGAVPVEGEPGYEVFTRLHHDIWQDGATPADALADKALQERMEISSREWLAHLAKAQAAMTHAVTRVATDLRMMNAPLALLGRFVNEYLATHHER